MLTDGGHMSMTARLILSNAEPTERLTPVKEAILEYQ